MFFLLFLPFNAFVSCYAEESIGSNDAQSVVNKIITHRERSHQLMDTDYCLKHHVSINTCDQLALHEYDSIEILLKAFDDTIHDYIDARYLCNIFIDEALILSSMDRHEESISKYQQALIIYPTSVTALSNLAYLEYSVHRDCQKAHEHYSYALEIDSGNAIVYYNFGLIVFMHINSVKTVRNLFPTWNVSHLNYLWNTALSLNPKLYQIYSNFASTSTDPSEIVGNYSAAIRASVLGGNMNNSVFWSLIVSKYSSGLPVVMPIHYNTSAMEQIQLIRSDYYSSLMEILSVVPWNIITVNLEEAVGRSSLGYYAIYHGYEDMLMRQVYANVFWKMAFSLIHFVPTESSPHHYSRSVAYEYEHDSYECIVNVSISNGGVATTDLIHLYQQSSVDSSFVDPPSNTLTLSKDRVKIGFL